ncbi:DUF885 domain-containing protein [Algibacillus agarilyticus]|uniref:DUF885 domain-containing protein n=1 Tax=Algibacillus agarilyticus TaxID=2234133 RepID=UPI0013005453|nr:DUF885 domain-containing protein [Algibacillus agarilyticus]
MVVGLRNVLIFCLFSSFYFCITAAQASADKNKSARQLDILTKNYYQANLHWEPLAATSSEVNHYNDKFIPPLTDTNIEKRLNQEKTFLALAEQITVEELSLEESLTLEHFIYLRKLAIERSQFPNHHLAINQMYGTHNDFSALGSGDGSQPFTTHKDYHHFVTRSKGYVRYMDSVIEQMRKGIKNGITLPQVLVEKLLPQFKTHIVEKVEDSLFWQPVKNIPPAFTSLQKITITQEYRRLIRDTLVPSFRRFYQFLQVEYLPHARKTIGYSALPNGQAWYQFKIKENISFNSTPHELHEFGKQEVARILSEMRKVKKSVGFSGDLAHFFRFLKQDKQFYFNNEQEVITAYNNIRYKINQKIPELFDLFPTAEYIIKPVEAFRAQSAAGASYNPPSLDGSRPGIFYVNTFNLKAQPKYLLETLSLHEAAPGHHFQISIQQELQNVPSFRRFSYSTVFVEGWALYAESLGHELGLFTDPYMWYGRLSDEQLRAMRLVVDTGMHAFGWTRKRAINYMKANSSLAESDIIAEVERYLAIPGQALAYKVGERVFRQLRAEAKTILGDRFNLKRFHAQILSSGALPMPILNKKIRNWIAQQQKLTTSGSLNH